MLKHLFKLTWNKKKQNFLLMLEIFISFFGLFVGFTTVLYPYNNYKLPMGFEPENIWVVNFEETEKITNIDSLQLIRESARTLVSSMSEVEDVSYSSVNIPFSGNGFNGPVSYQGRESWSDMFIAEDNFEKLMGLKLLEGRWFSPDDRAANNKPVIVDELLKEDLFGSEDAVGKIIASEVGERLRVVGVVAGIKTESEAERPSPILFFRADTANIRGPYAMLIKVKPGADVAFEARLYKALANAMKSSNIEIEHLTAMRDARNRSMQTPLVILLIIAGFLLINVGLGVFGVLWYNINTRKGEIGLRRAIGATGSSISRQLVTEAILIATLAIGLGLFFTVQFPLLQMGGLPVRNFVIAIVLSTVTMYILVIVCALYPGRQAAAIYPANALHED
jgi:putative ABC transport system permease protein